MRKGTNITLSQLIREAQPYQRLIVLFREPVSRYYSAFHYYGCARLCVCLCVERVWLLRDLAHRGKAC